MEFTIILATDEDRGIGKGGSLPWKSKRDLNMFQYITTYDSRTIFEFVWGKNGTQPSNGKQNALIMGRKTADSLKTALPNRLNMVLTSADSYREGFEVAKSLSSALNSLKKRDDVARVFICGGKRLYEEAIRNNWCRTVILSEIKGHYNCDTTVSEEFFDTLEGFETVYNGDFAENGDLEGVTFKEFECQNEEEMKYVEIGEDIMEKGHYRQNRNAKTYSLFGKSLEFEVRENPDGTFEVPILTTKQVFTRGVNEELLFFMNGKTDTLELEEKKIMIWNGNTKEEFLTANNFDLNPGEMGPMYGFIWRHFGAVYRGADHDYSGEGVDQLQNCITKLVEDPNSRRIVMTTYNPAQAEQGVLYPCHGLITQFYVEGDNRISLQTYQRSADYFLGLPFNIMSYSVFLCLVVKLVNAELERRGEERRYSTGRMITILGDVHIYSDVDEETGEGVDHITAVKKQSSRKPYRFPSIRFEKEVSTLADLMEMTASDIKVLNYARHPAIRAEMVA